MWTRARPRTVSLVRQMQTTGARSNSLSPIQIQTHSPIYSYVTQVFCYFQVFLLNLYVFLMVIKGATDLGYLIRFHSISLVATSSRLDPGPTQCTSVDTRDYFFRTWSGRTMKTTIRLHVVPRLRMIGAMPLLLYTPSYRDAWLHLNKCTFSWEINRSKNKSWS